MSKTQFPILWNNKWQIQHFIIRSTYEFIWIQAIKKTTVY